MKQHSKTPNPKYLRLQSLVDREGRSDRFTQRDEVGKREKKRLMHGLRTRNIKEVLEVYDDDFEDVDHVANLLLHHPEEL